MTLISAGILDRFGLAREKAGSPSRAVGRVDFVDYGKGLCIILVVMMHSTLGVGEAMNAHGWMHYPVEFSRPFRMPDFFLIAGLFLAKTIDAPWRRFLDRKVLHFAYFFVIWTAIHLVVKFGNLADPSLYGLLQAFAWRMVEPGSPLWFIYLLPVFFVTTRLVKKIPWQAVLLAAMVMETVPLTNCGMVIDEFMRRFVYFYAGYRFAPQIFAFARLITGRPAMALAGLALWAVINGLAVFSFSAASAPLAQFPGISLLLGYAGSFALVAMAALLAEIGAMRFLGWLGGRSIVVFLAFVLFMAPTRIVLVKLGLVTDVGTVSFIVMMAALIGPLVMAAVLARTPLRYLFVRPQWAKLENTA
ncbi:MAG: acyltransferase family protein [Beijerinckiaceae bacterium]|nr:acyltransferase family protein [Beijerinckiaceae bacterium]